MKTSQKYYIILMYPNCFSKFSGFKSALTFRHLIHYLHCLWICTTLLSCHYLLKVRGSLNWCHVITVCLLSVLVTLLGVLMFFFHHNKVPHRYLFKSHIGIFLLPTITIDFILGKHFFFTYSSNTCVTEILQDRVEVPSNRNYLNGFRTFCSGKGACESQTICFGW